jgi:asparagine synthase (glutamine-hydrolysing)
MRSDVPVGLTLSGGVDSASIACSVKKQIKGSLKAYTARFSGESFDEYGIAKRLCDEIDYNSVPVDIPYNNYINELKQIVYHLESGHGSPAVFPLWHITKRAKQDITVYLEGQGADEILGGYVNSVFFDYLWDLFSQGNFSKINYELKKHKESWPVTKSILLNFRLGMPAGIRKMYRYINGLEQLYSGEMKQHRPFNYDKLEHKGFNSVLNKKLVLMHQTGLVNLLHYGDAISMAHTMENRLPFLDYRLVEFVAQLPPQLKIKDGLGKYIHRNALKGIVPDFILNNPKKLGFVSPLKHIFSDHNSTALKILLGQKLADRNLFNKERLEKIIDEHISGKINHERILFKILSVELWFQNFIDND